MSIDINKLIRTSKNYYGSSNQHLPARLLASDLKGAQHYVVAVKFETSEVIWVGDQEDFHKCFENVPEEREGWVNIYRGDDDETCYIHSTLEKAIAGSKVGWNNKQSPDLIARIKIKYKVGEGL